MSYNQWAGFADAVASAALFMSTDRTLPVLRSVRVRHDSERGVNLAEATDRFSLAEQTFGEDADPEEWATFRVGADDVPTLVRNGDPRDVTVVEDKVTLDYGNGHSWTFAMPSGDYPPIQRLWTDAETTDTIGSVAFNPALLARLAKVAPYYAGHRSPAARPLKARYPVHLEFPDATKPLRATIGDRFRALIVPVRFADS
ncbi:hypothetical protein [Cellulosimicrobium cellulans]|uniref:hypothetical protein n=1 Tax=Cellulosimicrobium cellulans TaxID=1710 RepID=UPI0005BE83E9|nr:hypothetical protein [Cellulosimicrobium cellulans]